MPIPSFAARARLVLTAGAVFAVVACAAGGSSDANVVAPSREAGLTVSPVSAMLRVGDTLRFALPRIACDLTSARWAAGNPSVLSIDPLVGLATARDVGYSTVQVQQPGCSQTIGPSSVSVIP